MIAIGLYDQIGGQLLADHSARAAGVVFSTDRHGYKTLEYSIAAGRDEAFYLYDRPGLPWAVVVAYGCPIWQGRLEDIALIEGGLRLQAFGAQRALMDAPYTALWSHTKVAEWRAVLQTEVVNHFSEQYSLDTNNRLFIGLTKGTTYANPSNGGLCYLSPSGGDRQMCEVDFNYEVLLPANWQAKMDGYDFGFSNALGIWTLTATGVLQTGSVTAHFTGANARDIVEFRARNSTGAAYTYAGETGQNYVKITNLRVKTTSSVAIYADEIAAALATYVNGVNGDQLSADTMLIESPGVDLTDEVYSDALPSDILDRLVKYGDDQAPPREWEWGVYNDRRLHLRPRGSAGRSWFVDVSMIDLERTIETLRNSYYAIYREANGATLRSDLTNDGDSITRYGLTRRDRVDVSTTSLTQAQVYRNVALQDNKSPMPRASIKFDRLYDSGGALIPAWICQSGDSLTIRNLPPTLGTEIDRIRTFRIDETRYTVEADQPLEVTPESPRPLLDVLVARMTK